MMLSITSSERFMPDSARVATTICFTYMLSKRQNDHLVDYQSNLTIIKRAILTIKLQYQQHKVNKMTLFVEKF